MPELALVAFLILAYTLIAVRLDRLSISGPILLVTAGAILGPAGVGAIDAPANSEPFRVLAELTLALLLFTDASTIGLREAGRIAWLPGRLLAIGLPLTIAAGALVGWLLFPALGLGFAVLVGSILAPTDAALSLPLLLDRAIPVRVRRAINIESGLNDGIATPFVTLSLAIAAAEETTGTQHWLVAAGLEIAIAVAVAVIVGGVGGRLLVSARGAGLGLGSVRVARRRRPRDPRLRRRDGHRRERVRGGLRGRGRVPDPDRSFRALRRVRRIDRAGRVVPRLAALRRRAGRTRCRGGL